LGEKIFVMSYKRTFDDNTLHYFLTCLLNIASKMSQVESHPLCLSKADASIYVTTVCVVSLCLNRTRVALSEGKKKRKMCKWRASLRERERVLGKITFPLSNQTPRVFLAADGAVASAPNSAAHPFNYSENPNHRAKPNLVLHPCATGDIPGLILDFANGGIKVDN
jgi:hypothetical protein